MQYISLAIFSRLNWFPSPAVGKNWPFCVDMPLNNLPTNQPLVDIIIIIVNGN